MPTAKKAATAPARKSSAARKTGGAKTGRKAGRKTTARNATGAAPTAVTVRAYQVGFGDCFLLTFHYKQGGDRHVLIDFGSTGGPKDGGAGLLGRVAEDIRAECGGKLHAVVATHRHRDHISGFATDAAKTADGTPTGEVIRGLNPDVVIQPWTEHPDLARDATGPAKGLALAGAALTEHRGFVGALAAMHGVAGAALVEAEAMAEERRRAQKRPTTLARQLAFLGENNLKNRSAVENLMAMGARRDARYVFFGSASGLEGVLPGVTTRVLGPPTLEQSAEIRTQRQKDADEFWHFQARALRDALRVRGFRPPEAPAPPSTLFRNTFALEGDPPPYARWFVPRMRAARGDQLLELVRILDDAMNNTSVILLFRAGGKTLLFPGDAQIENWSYALSHEDVRAELGAVDLYKVGHHGSLNATPKTLWGLFGRRGGEGAADRLRTVVSTAAGKHGHANRGTEVPRRKLVAALKAESDFITTQDLKATALRHDVRIEL